MTASLPVPNDIDPEEPDRHSSAPVVRLPAPQNPPADTARPAAKPRKGQSKGKPRRPSAPRAAQPPKRGEAPVDPGPPPPLPSDLEILASSSADLVVPPRPPLPPSAAATGAVFTSPEPEAVVAEPVAPTINEPEPEAAITEPEPEPEAAMAEPEAAITEAEAATSSEPPSEADPIRATEPDVEAAAGITSGQVVASEPATAAEPVLEAEPAPQPEVADEPLVETVPVREPEIGWEAEPVRDVETIPSSEADPRSEREPDPASLPVLPAPLPVASGDVLVLRGVTKRFGSTHAVEGIDLTVPAGTFYGLVGPNGAGKTTTLSMIAGLLNPDRGTIRIGGVDASAKPLAAKKLLGVLPDRLRTFDRLTGRQLLYYYGVLRGLPPAVVESRTRDLARAFDLESALGRSVSDYSAGMLKKVMLAGALIHSPRLLVLDEPFEAVDPVSSAIILDILSTYVAHGGTVILSSHGMELVERVCTRVAVLVAGQVLAEGTVDEVRGELTLEQRFVELAGGLSDVEGLEWLHTFSD